MTDVTTRLQGLWLPLITPFRDGALDEPSLRSLVRHWCSVPRQAKDWRCHGTSAPV